MDARIVDMVAPAVVCVSADVLVIIIGVVDMLVLMMLELGDIVVLLVVDCTEIKTIRMRN